MGIHITVMITSMAMLVGLAYANEGEITQDVCNGETFEAQCQSDEVIVIHSALLGRMSISRCVRTNFGYVGCYTDVHHVVDMLCSGYPSCQVEVNGEAEGTGPMACPRDFRQYLQVTYSCI